MLRLVVDHNDLHKRKLYKTYTSDDVTKAHNSEDEYNEFINDVQLTPVAFMKLCPALLAQIDQHVCMRPAPLTNGVDPKQALWNGEFSYNSCIYNRTLYTYISQYFSTRQLGYMPAFRYSYSPLADCWAFCWCRS